MDTLLYISNAYSSTTSLVSLYVPASMTKAQLFSHINQEITTANNIKDKNTSKNVSYALKSIIGKLKSVPMSSNGSLIFSGIYDMKNIDNLSYI